MNKDQEEVIKQAIAQTMRELSQPKAPVQKSRVWKDPEGYRYLAVWQNAALLRVLVRKFTLTLPLWEKRLKAQLDDVIDSEALSLIAQTRRAARSQKRNIEEGWKRPTTSEYLEFLGYTQASLEEVKGDLRDAQVDGFLKSIKGSNLLDIGIDLNIFKGPSRGQVKGEPTDPGHPYYLPLTTLNPSTLTLEIFMELINKTDYLLRTLVESLENKLQEDKKDYLITKAKIRDRIKR